MLVRTRETDRQTDREKDRQKHRETETNRGRQRECQQVK